MARVDLHAAGDGLEGAVLEVVVGLLVQVALLLAEALLEQLPLVPELDDRLGVGVERGDGGRHAAGEGAPRHAGRRETKTESLSIRAPSLLFTDPGHLDGNVSSSQINRHSIESRFLILLPVFIEAKNS